MNAMENLSETLPAPHQGLIHARPRPPILSTTGTRAALALLAARIEDLEEAVRTLTEIADDLAESQLRRLD